MSDTIDQLIDRVIQREGGYVNDPNDAGGPTKYGITLATLQAWRNSAVSAFDVEKLTPDEARAIYRNRYIQPAYDVVPHVPTLEELFDYGVNSGPAAAARSLQTILKREGLYAGLIDGAAGPLTRAALARVANWPALFYALKCERYEALLRYIGSSPSQSIYAVGWANRLDTIESPIA